MMQEGALSTLQIQLLGDFRLVYDNESLTERFSPRAQTLLAYLLLECQTPASRAQIAYTLWPDSSDAQARTNLRRELHGLRQILPDADGFLAISPKTVSWKTDAPFAFDVALFEREIQQAAEAASPTAKRAAYEQAIACYHGDLLPGHYDEWLLTRQEELRQAHLRLLEQLASLLYAEREYASAIGMVQKLLQVDPLHEAGYRQLMELYAQSGKRAQALHTYHSCVTIFERELGVAPGTEIQQLYEQLTQSEEAALAPSAGRSGRAKLVGRQAEWQTLLAAWQHVGAGTPHFVLIEGEAGIGKTRLAEELLEWVNRQGIASARTRSFAAEGSLAYAPVIELLRSDAIRKLLESLDDVWLSEIARLLPDLLIDRPDLPTPEPMTERHQRQRLFEALARTFTAKQQPILLLLDDLQWCDQETLEWLRYLVRFDDSTALLIVGTARSEEVDTEHSLRALAMDLQRDEQLTSIDLAPLSQEETADLTTLEQNGALDGDAVERIYQASEGNPLFVVEMVRAGINLDDTNTPRSSLPHPQSLLPPKVYAIIQHRLSTLSPTTRSIASLAATIGRDFSFDVLVEASDQSEDEVVNGLDELWRRKVVREQDGSGYDFGHDRIREAAYAALSPMRKRVLHRQVAGALIEIYHANLGVVSGQLARHYEECSDFESAITWHQRAAEAAHQLFVDDDAIEHLTAASQLCKFLPASDDNKRIQLAILLRLLEPVSIAEGYWSTKIRSICDEAMPLCQKVGTEYQLCDILFWLGISHQMRAELADANAVLKRMLALAKKLQNRPSSVNSSAEQRVRNAHHLLAGTLFHQGKLQQAQSHFEKAFMFESSVVPLARSALNMWLLGYPVQSRKQMCQAIVIANQHPHPHPDAFAADFALRLSICMKMKKKAQLWVRRLLFLSSKYTFPFFITTGEFFKITTCEKNKIEEADFESLYANLLQLQKLQQYNFYSFRLWNVANLYFEHGRIREALEFIGEMHNFVISSGECFWNAELHRLHGEILLAKSAPDSEVEACYQRALSIANEQSAKMLNLRATVSQSRLWARQGRRAEARQQLQEIYDWFTEGFETKDLTEARALLEELA